MTLTRIPQLSLLNARMLVDAVGSGAEVMDHRHSIRDIVPEATDRLVHAFDNIDEACRRAEAELRFASDNNIACLPITDTEAYPQLLTQCSDAPLVLYYMGNAPLNVRHIVSIVGTRRITEQGKDLCRHFVADLARACPDVLVVSGLAYGVDIHSHRAALSNGLSTVAVLAHGLDTIYPSVHRQTAVDMLGQGGLLTEYMSHTPGEKGNFVRRNRIVAGMAHATVVVESAAKGGALITAELADEYNRDVFAFPGRVTDQYSEGCNRLIHAQKARLITSAGDFLEAVGWAKPAGHKAEARQQELFPTLTPEQQRIVAVLAKADNMNINQIVVDTNMPFAIVSAMLFELELKGMVAPIGGARYRIIK